MHLLSGGYWFVLWENLELGINASLTGKLSTEQVLAGFSPGLGAT